MSERWQGTGTGNDLHRVGDVDRRELDMAARYASQLRELREKCRDDPKFYMKILGYSETTQGMTKNFAMPTPPNSAVNPLGSAPNRRLPIPAKTSSRPPFPASYEHPGGTTFYQQRMMSSPNSITGLAQGSSAYSPDIHSSPNQSRFYRPQGLNTTPPLIDLPITQMGAAMSDSGSTSEPIERHSNDDVLQDELSVMSQLLLGQQFLEMDR